MALAGDWKGDATAEALHADLCTAIADLAKSVEVTVHRMALRANCTAAIADASKAELAAELLRTTAAHSPKHKKLEDPTLVPFLPTASRHEHATRDEMYRSDAADELCTACNWLAAVQYPRIAPREDGYRDESKIAMRVLELQVRDGGLTREHLTTSGTEV